MVACILLTVALLIAVELILSKNIQYRQILARQSLETDRKTTYFLSGKNNGDSTLHSFYLTISFC